MRREFFHSHRATNLCYMNTRKLKYCPSVSVFPVFVFPKPAPYPWAWLSPLYSVWFHSCPVPHIVTVSSTCASQEPDVPYQLRVCPSPVHVAYKNLIAARITLESLTNSTLLKNMIGCQLGIGKFLLKCLELLIEGFRDRRARKEAKVTG